MDNKERAAVILDKYLSASPKIVHIPRDISDAVRSEFINSATFHIEQLGREIADFETSKREQNDFVIRTRGILHNIKGEAGMMEIAEISNVCCLAGVLLNENCQTVQVSTLHSVKNWLLESVQLLKSAGSGLPPSIFSVLSVWRLFVRLR